MSSKEVKVVFSGSVHDEKVALLMVLNDKPYPEKYIPTIFENYTQEVTIEGIPIKFHIWDTAGQDEYDRLRPLSYSGANAVALTFLLNDKNTFNEIKTKWYKEAKKYCKNAALVLIGLCLDKREDGNPNHVTDKEAEQMVRDLHLSCYISCSAKTQEGVDKILCTIAKAINSKNKGSCNIEWKKFFLQQ